MQMHGAVGTDFRLKQVPEIATFQQRRQFREVIGEPEIIVTQMRDKP